MLKEYKLYQGAVIRFDDEKHRFWNEKGEALLSVTSITGVIDKSAPLMGWAVNQMGDYLLASKEKKITEELINKAKREYRRLTKEAADIGTQIHQWVSDWILGKKPEMPVDERVVNGITAFLKFQKENKIKWVESERVIYSRKHQYAGILDAVGKMGRDLVLIDFKSSNGIYPEFFLQTAGYKIAYTEETGKKIDKRLIIRFGKDTGEFEAKALDGDKKDERAFLACLQLKKRLRELQKVDFN